MSIGNGEFGEIVGFERGGRWIASVDFGETWYDEKTLHTEHGPTDDELADSQSMTVHYRSDTGEDVYFTLFGGLDEDYTVDDAIADAEDRYGQAAV